MPTYEYACKSCGRHLDVVQSFSDEPLTECPSCQGVLRKVYAAVGIAFKGSGFYKTDSRTKSPKVAAKSGSDGNGNGSTSSSDGSKSEGSKTDSKPSGDSAAKTKDAGSGDSGGKAKESSSKSTKKEAKSA